jgi:ribosome biogenesis GTPase A
MAFRGKVKSHHEPYWDSVKRVIFESDIVLEVIDARLVELSRNEEVEKLVEEAGRPIIFVVNKSDLVSKDKIKKQIEELKKKGEVVFISAKDKKSVKILLFAIKKMFSKHGKREETIIEKGAPKKTFREAKGDIIVGVLGYPNVGKSSIINVLAHKVKMKVSKKSGTTHGVHWIKATSEIKLIDSPGVIPLQKDDDVRYGLIGARDSEKIRHPEVVVEAIIKLFMKNNKSAFENFYDIKIDKEDYDSVINNLGRRKRFLISGDRIDENRTCTTIIKDWQEGRLRL